MSGRAWSSRRLASGRWQARYPYQGERLEASQTFSTKKAADSWLRQKRIEIERGEHLDPKLGRMKLSDYVELVEELVGSGGASGFDQEPGSRLCP